ncbi:MAG TPA: helix-turn-helix domain-containing protein, partial [Victivallales bacterium]|nr:helix-turn-helix domain-containing protein [Victivallales bacterium]
MKDFNKDQDLFSVAKKPAKSDAGDISPQLDLDLSFDAADDQKQKEPERKPVSKQEALTDNKKENIYNEEKKEAAEKVEKHEAKTGEETERQDENKVQKSQRSLKELKELARAASEVKSEKRKIDNQDSASDNKIVQNNVVPTAQKPNRSVTETPKQQLSAQTAPKKQEQSQNPNTKKVSAPIIQTSAQQPKTGAKQVNVTEGSSVGHVLQEARVKAGLSIDQVAIETRIKKAYVEAIERDDFEHLPSAVYVNAYVRRLCQQYGLDESL